MAISCYDVNGKRLKSLTQWDHGLSLMITGVQVDPAPEIRYSNKKRGEAICVDSEVRNSNELWSVIPDELLQDPLPITVQVFYSYETGDSKTEYQFRIPVAPAAKPDCYAYTPSEVKTWTELDARIDKLENSVSGPGVTSVNGMTGDVEIDIPEYEGVRTVNGVEPDEHGNVTIEITAGGSDWNQNDPAQPDYVKNRTHWEEGSQTVIEWEGENGNVEGLDYFIHPGYGGGLKWYKLSDQPIIKGGVIPDFSFDVVMDGAVTHIPPDDVPADEADAMMKEMWQEYEGGWYWGDWILSVESEHVGGTDTDTVHVGRGTYFAYYPTCDEHTEIYVRKLTCGSSTVHQLDDKFIPDTISRKSDVTWGNLPDKPFFTTRTTVVWDGSKDGKDTFVMDGETFYKLSDETPKKAELVDGGDLYSQIGSYGAGSLPFGSNEHLFADLKGGLRFDTSGSSVNMVVVYATEVASGVVAPSTGIYITVPDGLNKAEITFYLASELDEKFIPESIARVSQLPDPGDVISPTATVAQTDTGATISITDKNGTTTAVIYNGLDGQPGPQGPKGETGPQGEKGELTDSDRQVIADLLGSSMSVTWDTIADKPFVTGASAKTIELDYDSGVEIEAAGATVRRISTETPSEEELAAAMVAVHSGDEIYPRTLTTITSGFGGLVAQTNTAQIIVFYDTKLTANDVTYELPSPGIYAVIVPGRDRITAIRIASDQKEKILTDRLPDGGVGFEQMADVEMSWDGDTEGCDKVQALFYGDPVYLYKISDSTPDHFGLYGAEITGVLGTGEAISDTFDDVVTENGITYSGLDVFVFHNTDASIDSWAVTVPAPGTSIPSTGTYIVHGEKGFVGTIRAKCIVRQQIDEKFIPEGIARKTDIPELDDTLTHSGMAADAKAVGDAITNIESSLLSIDYDAVLAFDTSEVIFGSTNTSSVLGRAILGQMILA